MSDKENNIGTFTAGDNFFGQMMEAGIADENFVREIVLMFLDEGQQSLNQLRAAFVAKNEKEFKLFAHKLKSSFLMFDMHEAHSLAVKLETIEVGAIENAENELNTLEETCATHFELLRLKYLKQ